MLIDRAPTPEFMPILTQVLQAFRGQVRERPAAAAVVLALVEAERAAKQQRLHYDLAALMGQWQLYFVANKRARRQGEGLVGKGWYVPKLVPAQISFGAADSEGAPGRVTIGNQVKLGPLALKLTGPAQYPGKKNLLAFDFTQMQLLLGPRSLYQGNIRGGKAESETWAEFSSKSIGQLPFFAFFLVTEDLIAARGRGGGLALWIRHAERP
jgi:hypothetical protein